VIHASRSSDLVCVKVSRDRVFHSGLKTGGSAMTDGCMTPLRRLRRKQVEDRWVDAMGCVGPCYSCFAIFVLLGLMGIIVF
jgi:hypothetical protein